MDCQQYKKINVLFTASGLSRWQDPPPESRPSPPKGVYILKRVRTLACSDSVSNPSACCLAEGQSSPPPCRRGASSPHAASTGVTHVNQRFKANDGRCNTRAWGGGGGWLSVENMLGMTPIKGVHHLNRGATPASPRSTANV